MNAGRIRLTVGPGALAWVLYGVLLLLSVPFWLIALVTLVSLLDGGGLFAGVLMVLNAVVCGLIVFMGVRIYQRAYWLEGTVLVQRRLAGKRRCDLSTAWVSAETVSASPLGGRMPLPRLVAWHDGEVPIRLWIRDPDRRRALLPAAELVMLARSISLGREDDPRIRPVVEGLHRMATDPWGLGAGF